MKKLRIIWRRQFQDLTGINKQVKEVVFFLRKTKIIKMGKGREETDN